MTDKPTATSLTEEADPTKLWRVDGVSSVTGDDRGLDDTVVRLQPIRDDDFGAAAPSSEAVASEPQDDWSEAGNSVGEDSLAQVEELAEADSVGDEPLAEPDPLIEAQELAEAEESQAEDAAALAGESEGLPPEPEASEAEGPVLPAADGVDAQPADTVFAPLPEMEAPVQYSGTAPLPPIGGPLAPPVVVPAPPVVPPPVAAAPPVAKPATKPASRRTRKARLRVARVDPWSVMKTTFLFSIAAGIMVWVATYVTWSVIEASGLFSVINDQIVNLISSPNDASPWRIEDYLSANKVLGVTALVAVINVVLLTALGTLFAFLYNLSANILGGLELTLAED